MKQVSPHIVLVVSALIVGLVACAAAPVPTGSKELVATDVPPPPPPPPPPPTSTGVLPPDRMIAKATDDQDRTDKEILSEDQKKESDFDGAKADRGDGARARGTADPLDAFGQGASAGEGGPLLQGAGGIGSNAKGASHGAGTGASGSADRSGSAPGAATEVRGSIDNADIKRVVRTHINEVKHCYEQGLARRPDLEGKVVLKFTIGKTGTVVAATVQETTLNERQVEQCISGAAMRWSFPKPTGDGLVVISYPFVLKTAN